MSGSEKLTALEMLSLSFWSALLGSCCYRYSPAILLLRHFDVFRDSHSPEDPLNDQRGNTSEVASVIRKFTEPVSQHSDRNSQGKSNGEFVRI